MTTTNVFTSIRSNADLAEKTIKELQNNLESLTARYNSIKTQQLVQENEKLKIAIEAAKTQLIQLETKNGVKQIPLPNQQFVQTSALKPTDSNTVEIKSPILEKVEPVQSTEKVKKEKKLKENAKKDAKIEEPPVDVGRLDLRIATIEDVQKHPDADSLYVLKINCGENKPRTVCSGLVKFVPIDKLQERDVLLLCNLKPVKMRGITSEAMVMCASTPEVVEVLQPPAGCQPGDHVQCEGYNRNPDPVMNPKKKIFETVAPDLATNSLLQACYKGTPLNVPGKGNIVAATLKNSPVK